MGWNRIRVVLWAVAFALTSVRSLSAATRGSATVVLSGTVSDGSGAGWPLCAHRGDVRLDRADRGLQRSGDGRLLDEPLRRRHLWRRGDGDRLGLCRGRRSGDGGGSSDREELAAPGQRGRLRRARLSRHRLHARALRELRRRRAADRAGRSRRRRALRGRLPRVRTRADSSPATRRAARARTQS